MAKKHKKHKKGGLLSKLSFRTKVIAAVAVASVVVIGLVVTLLVIINQKTESSDSGDPFLTAEQKADRDARVKRSQRDGALLDQASEAIEKGDQKRADEVYSEAIDAEANTENKLRLSIDQARMLYYSNEVEKSIAVAKEAEKMSDDKFLIAFWLARVYEEQRQYEQARDYYLLSAKWAKSDMNHTGLEKAHFEREAARVGTLAGKAS